MHENIVLFIELFFLVLCSLDILKNIYKVVKVALSHEGKVEESKFDTWVFALSVAYVLSIIILGF